MTTCLIPKRKSSSFQTKCFCCQFKIFNISFLSNSLKNGVKIWSYCRLFKELDFLSSISSMGDEEERRELSEGLKDGLLLSP